MIDARDFEMPGIQHKGRAVRCPLGIYYKAVFSTRDNAYLFQEVHPSSAEKGAVECLWDIFGGTTTEKGFKVLHERVGLIYGDSITLDRAKRIMERLEAKGFASCNCVFGIGL